MRTVYINGRFLTQSVTGVQRFARGIVRALDELLVEGHAKLRDYCFVVLCPEGAASDLRLSRIQVRQVGRGSGHVWDQTTLARSSRDGVLISLCGSGPVMHGSHVVAIHDAAVFRQPAEFSAAYALLHRSLGRALARTAALITVSNFSKGELESTLKPSRSVQVVPNAVDQFSARPASDAGPAAQLVPDRPYFLVLGSVKKNKNLRLISQAVTDGADMPPVVVVGERNDRVFGDSQLDESKFVFLGRRSDDEVLSLMKSAIALLFPSTYEGFGLPPLEAMAAGCPVLAADIPAVTEVCGQAARYFSPYDPEALRRLMIAAAAEDEAARDHWRRLGRARAAEFSWRASALTLCDLVEAL